MVQRSAMAGVTFFVGGRGGCVLGGDRHEGGSVTIIIAGNHKERV